MRILQTILVAFVVMAAASQTGCAKAPGAVGEEKSSMLKGTQTVFHADPVAITAAAKEVADQLKLTVEKNQSSGLDGKLIAKSANRMKLVVSVKAHGVGDSLVTVRAGGFGDRGVQKQVLERIKAKLPATAYTPTPMPATPAPVANAPQPMTQMQATTDNAQLPF